MHVTSVDVDRRAKEVFLAARDVPGMERADYVNSQCADDDHLRARVQLLLEAEENAGRFMAAPTAGQAAIHDVTDFAQLQTALS